MLPPESQSRERPVALVTGARRGIGRFVAERLLQLGYQVVGCARSPDAWSADGFTYQAADVTDEAAVRGLVAAIDRRFGRLDVVVNVAGAGPIVNHVLLTPTATMQRLLNTNVMGTFLVSREAARLMRRRNGGRIVNISSVSAPLRLAGEAAYGASKRAVEGLSQIMARELAPFGITVNVVGPTPLRSLVEAGIPAEKLDALAATLPIKRLGTLEDVWNVLTFFLDPASEAVTGQIVYLGGVPNG